MKIAFIHSNVKIGTGASYINDLISIKLKQRKIKVKNFYPTAALIDSPHHMKGLRNILFFYSLLEKKDDILSYDLVQGTTYTPLPFLTFKIPVVSHFGSTTEGFLRAVKETTRFSDETSYIYYQLKKAGIIDEINIQSRKPLRDIAEIEEYVAAKVNAIIVTSDIVRGDLTTVGIDPKKIHVVHNAIEDFWFDERPRFVKTKAPSIVYVGRFGSDVFNFKLKGVDRIIDTFNNFPQIPKSIFTISTDKDLLEWMRTKIANTEVYANVVKKELPFYLKKLCGSILFIPSRYEGFCLSIVEGMAKGLVPVVYPVGIAPEIITDGYNGFIVHSQREARNRIQELLKDSNVRISMARNAYETATQFTTNTMIDKMIEVYTDILKK